MENIIEILKCRVCGNIAENAVESVCCADIFCEKCSKILINCQNCGVFAKFVQNIPVQKITENILQPCVFCKNEYLRKNMSKHYLDCPLATHDCLICSSSIYSKDITQHLLENHEEIIFKNFFSENVNDTFLTTKINKLGREAKFGINGKYYCEGPIDYPCGCCNGVCGPLEGCNCTACLKLDIEQRNLPNGFFVNKTGAICKSTNIGIYCG